MGLYAPRFDKRSCQRAWNRSRPDPHSSSGYARPRYGQDRYRSLRHEVQFWSTRLGRHLERRELLVRDTENSFLALSSEESANENALVDVQGHSITYRLRMVPRRAASRSCVASRHQRRDPRSIARVPHRAAQLFTMSLCMDQGTGAVPSVR